jgi:Ni,Fe-hydrogenase III large subunit
VYGLNFSSKDDADVFATAMIKALEVWPSLYVFSRIIDNSSDIRPATKYYVPNFNHSQLPYYEFFFIKAFEFLFS